jgi:hypothetical protein
MLPVSRVARQTDDHGTAYSGFHTGWHAGIELQELGSVRIPVRTACSCERFQQRYCPTNDMNSFDIRGVERSVKHNCILDRVHDGAKAHVPDRQNFTLDIPMRSTIEVNTREIGRFPHGDGFAYRSARFTGSARINVGRGRPMVMPTAARAYGAPRSDKGRIAGPQPVCPRRDRTRVTVRRRVEPAGLRLSPCAAGRSGESPPG